MYGSKITLIWGYSSIYDCDTILKRESFRISRFLNFIAEKIHVRKKIDGERRCQFFVSVTSKVLLILSLLFLFIFCLNMFFDISPVVYKQPIITHHTPACCVVFSCLCEHCQACECCMLCTGTWPAFRSRCSEGEKLALISD